VKKNQVAVQLYTLRDHLTTAKDTAATLKKVRAMGYQTVEVAGLGKVNDDELVALLKGEGLAVCAVHESGDLILNEPGRTAERVVKLGGRYAVYAWPAGIDFSKPEVVRKFIAALENSGQMMKAAGVTLCYHNHHMEFRRLGARTILEDIFAGTGEQHVQAELDTHWVQVGGCNPADWCRKMSGRLPLLHMKDYAINNDNKTVFAEIGNGNLDWPRIIAAADAAGCSWYIVEQDTCPGDPFVSIKQSFEYVTTRLCSG
jgi:sugar phosphate isomerase/epimerase